MHSADIARTLSAPKLNAMQVNEKEKHLLELQHQGIITIHNRLYCEVLELRVKVSRIYDLLGVEDKKRSKKQRSAKQIKEKRTRMSYSKNRREAGRMKRGIKDGSSCCTNAI